MIKLDKKDEKESYYTPTDRAMNCCKVESVISIDDRGQMVLPKKIRDKAKINAGDKLAVVIWEGQGKSCCISLIKAEDLAGTVKSILSPMMEDIGTK